MSFQSPTQPLPEPTRSASMSPATAVDKYIEKQLQHASRQVRLNDVVTSLILMVIWTLSVLLLAIVIDAWVVSLGTLTRWLFFVVLIVGLAAIAFVKLVRASFRHINPKYSAKMIEAANDRFNNSLINYSYLQASPSAANRPAIVQAVSKRAAQDLSQVSNLEKIDRATAIRWGLILVGLAAFMVLYAILSPKSPWATIQRVLWPTAAVARPSIVKIVDVTPGDTRLFFGERLLVTASIKGQHNPDDVQLIFSSSDGRFNRVVVLMQLAAEDGNYQGVVSTTDSGALDTDLSYWIEAGDAQSRQFYVTVNPNPTIAVEDIRIEPPAYTKLAKRELRKSDVLSGIEGSRVFVNALANMPIKVAYVELLKTEPGLAKSASSSVISSITMSHDGQTARGDFLLLFDRKQRTPEFTHFQLKFVSVDGHRNETTNIYPIRITPDLGPEIQMIKPEANEIHVPVNGSADLEVLAHDLDYEIASVRVVFDHQGTRLLDESIQLPTETSRQIVTSRMSIEPLRLRLSPGDKAIFYAEAADNRMSPHSHAPEPNTARTDNYTLIVEEADLNAQNKNKNQEENPNQDSDPKDNEQTNNETNDKSNPKEKSGDPDEDTPQPSEKNSGDEKTSEENSKDNPNPDSETVGESSDPKPDEASDETTKEDGNSDSKSENGGNQKSGSEPKNTGDAEDEGGNHPNPGSDSNNNEKSEANKNPNPGNDGSEASQGDSPKASNSKQNAGTEPSEKGGDISDQNNSSTASQSPSNNNENEPSASDAGKSDASNAVDSDAGDGVRDENLTDGEQQALDEDATDAERMKRLLEKIEEDKKRRQDSQDSSESTDNNSNESDNNSNPQNSNQGDSKAENPIDKNPSEPGDSQTPNTDTSKSNEKNGGVEKSNAHEPKDKGSDQKSNEAEQGNTKQTDSKDQSPSKNGSADEKSEPPSSEKSNDKQNQSPKDNQSDSGQPSKATPDDSDPRSPKNDKISGEPNPDGNSNVEQGNTGDTESNSPDTTPNSSQPSEQKGSSQKGGGGAGSNSGGMSSSPQQKNAPSEVQGNDANLPLDPNEENLDYSKEATDLVLKYLKDQKENPDPKLLEEMNWTEEDMRDFLERYEKMADAARKGTPQDRQRYENTLKSLGLNPNKQTRRDVKGTDQRMENISEGGPTNRAPSELEDEFNAFMKSRNRLQSLKK